MAEKETAKQDWASRGKSIRQLIKELQSFEDQDMPVEISIDGGDTHIPISLVGRSGKFCLLITME